MGIPGAKRLRHHTEMSSVRFVVGLLAGCGQGVRRRTITTSMALGRLGNHYRRLFFLGWAVYPDTQIRLYTIREEDEMEFVQAWRTLDRISDIELAHTVGDLKATGLAERMSALFASYTGMSGNGASPSRRKIYRQGSRFGQ